MQMLGVQLRELPVLIYFEFCISWDQLSIRHRRQI